VTRRPSDALRRIAARLEGGHSGPSVQMQRWFAASLALRRRTWPGTLRTGRNLRLGAHLWAPGEGTVSIGDDCWVGWDNAGCKGLPVQLEAREALSEIVIGTRSMVMNGASIIARESVRIGDDCAIGSGVLIVDSDFHGLASEERADRGSSTAVVIEDNVYVCPRSIILKGVRIGRDSFVGAGSVVARDVPPGSVVAGNPAQVRGSVYDRGGPSPDA
jgi:acetyltransferase-like isoleucine patch superfamily enzyme